MAATTYYHFKAATGFGAVVDGSAPADSADQINRLLLKQGLIPVRIWSELDHQQHSQPFFRALGKYLLAGWRAAH